MNGNELAVGRFVSGGAGKKAEGRGRKTQGRTTGEGTDWHGYERG